MIAKIIKAEVDVHSTHTEALIILAISAKPESNNCFIINIESTYSSNFRLNVSALFSSSPCRLQNLVIYFPLLLIMQAVHSMLALHTCISHLCVKI